MVLSEQEQTRRPVGELVVALGFASSAAVSGALAEQKGWSEAGPGSAAPPTDEEPVPDVAVEPAPADDTLAEHQNGDRHLLLLPTPTGYELLERHGIAPAAGATIELAHDEGTDRYLVLKTTRAPFPTSGLRCAYLQAF